ncbi:MAG: NAD-dependent epimerase/dehydratase family protein [Elusimicrobiota bacterium]
MNKTTLLEKDNVLIVGGTGFIGGHLTRRCLDYTPHVTVLGFPEKNMDSKAEFIKADLTDIKELSLALKNRKFDYVFNCSGYIDHTPYLKGGRKVIEAHYTGLLNLLDCIDTQALKGFVQIGSSDEYGCSPAPQKESMRENPISPYSLAKVNASHFIQMASKFEGFPGVVVRFFLVYGPGQDEKRFLPQIIKACLTGESFKSSLGIQSRDFCYIDDITDGMISAAVSEKAKGHIINLASGKPVKIKQMIETVVKLTGGGNPQWGAHPYRKGENMELYADASLSKELLGWEPKISLEEGLKRTIEFYKNSGK